jgi:pilus assembly protein CpaC
VVTPRLARVLPPDFALPTDSYIPPTRSEYFWKGQIEGTPPNHTPVAPTHPGMPQPLPETRPEPATKPADEASRSSNS